MSKLPSEIKKIFEEVSTATVCTVLFKRGLRNQYIQNVFPLNPNLGNMVGPAFTLRYIPAREDRNSLQVFENPRHPQRVSIEKCPVGAVLVIDSRKDARVASAGSILIQRLYQRGAAGIVTDGGFRDSPEIKNFKIPAYHSRPSAPTNLGLNEAIDMNIPIACGDVAVFPNDIIVGDQEGVVVIPQEIVVDVAYECEEMTRFEDFVMKRVKEGVSIIGLYPPTSPKWRAKYQQWKVENKK